LTDPLSRLTAALADRYRIERELGQGGMATVYLAHDVRHDRKVALKVLRPELSAILGAERFLAEIKTTANLQHPHILSLFDSGEAAGLVFYVMPYVEGESLRDRLDRETQLSVDDAVRIAREVADALAYAHGQGVIHRDIKPENILLYGGHAMVADFGIALAVSRSDGGTRMTETGMSLGTPHYMSPEQAMGDKEITPKTDIYALGCVLYEMLVGEPPFTGPTAQAIVAKVMTAEVTSLSAQRRSVPDYVEATVLQALEKLPADRFGSAQEFLASLSGTMTTQSMSRSMARAPSPGPWRNIAYAALGVAVVGVALAAWGMTRSPVAGAVPSVAFRLSQDGPTAPNYTGDVRPALAISPDGSHLAYRAEDGGRRSIAVRDLGSVDARLLPGTEGARDIVFSPDGRSLLFRQGTALKRTSLSGTPPIRVAEIGQSPSTYGLVWLPSDTIYYLIEASRSIYKVSADGNSAPVAIPLPDSIGLLSELSPIPDTEWLLSSELSSELGGGRTATIVVLSTRTGEIRRLNGKGVGIRLLSDRHHLLLGKDNGLLTIVAFDPKRLELSGPEVPVLDGVQATVIGLPSLELSTSGVLAFVTGRENDRTVVEVDRSGRVTPLMTEPAEYKDPRWSPDGTRIAVEIAQGMQGDLWIRDMRAGTQTRLTNGSENLYPIWTPDGRRIVFTSRRAGLAGLWWQPVDGGSEAESLQPGNEQDLRFPHDISPDGRTLLVRTNTAASGFDIGAMELKPNGEFRPVLATPENEGSPVFSPDGKWMAYTSDASGTNEVYVTPWPEVGRRAQLSSGGGQEPQWNPQGGELFYRTGDAMVAVRLVEQDGLLAPARRDTLFSGPFFQQPRWPEYDVSRDGTRFLMIRRGSARQEIVVITGWAEQAVKKLAEGGGTTR
jgi:Tol biopolymer transport system component/tRNA A-37 threonylcarbamoyl transferase component Bud32